MTQVWFVGDLHLGHKSIVRHRPGPYTTVEGHDEWVMQQCLSVGATKRSLWYLLGDVAMERSKLDMLRALPGRRILVRGNHDIHSLADYAAVFEDVTGTFSRYGFWVSHVPVHPEELRGKVNIHGHSHDGLKPDHRYLNAAIEHLPEKKPVSLDQVRTMFERKGMQACTCLDRSLGGGIVVPDVSGCSVHQFLQV